MRQKNALNTATPMAVAQFLAIMNTENIKIKNNENLKVYEILQRKL